MTHYENESIQNIQARWRKKQQLIRQKYKIPYNMTYILKPCYTKLETKASIIDQKSALTGNENERETKQLVKDCLNNPDLPPIFCSKCQQYLTKCSCQDGLGQWWINRHNKPSSTDEKSKVSSTYKRHVNFATSQNDLSSIKNSKSQIIDHKQQYALLDWNNRESLLHFLQTTTSHQNLSNMTVKQLQNLITNNNQIHIFNSINDLMLMMTKEQDKISLCDIYIDPDYYSMIEGINPLSQSNCLADNINLNQTLYSIEKIANLLGIKLDKNKKIFSNATKSSKQRKEILNQQIFYLTSRISSKMFHNPPNELI